MPERLEASWAGVSRDRGWGQDRMGVGSRQEPGGVFEPGCPGWSWMDAGPLLHPRPPLPGDFKHFNTGVQLARDHVRDWDEEAQGGAGSGAGTLNPGYGFGHRAEGRPGALASHSTGPSGA